MFNSGRIRLETRVIHALETRSATPNELAKKLEIVPRRLLEIMYYLEAVGVLKRIQTPFFEGTIYDHEINTEYAFNGTRNVKRNYGLNSHVNEKEKASIGVR